MCDSHRPFKISVVVGCLPRSGLVRKATSSDVFFMMTAAFVLKPESSKEWSMVCYDPKWRVPLASMSVLELQVNSETLTQLLITMPM